MIIQVFEIILNEIMQIFQLFKCLAGWSDFGAKQSGKLTTKRIMSTEVDILITKI
jgi:hypothetical protein